MAMSKLRKLCEDYVFMRNEIVKLQSEDTTATDVVRGSLPDAPYTSHSIRVRGIDTQYAKFLDARISSLKAKCALVEDTILNAPNSQVRLILTYRYLDGLDWDSIGEALPRKRGGEACRKVAERYLKTREHLVRITP